MKKTIETITLILFAVIGGYGLNFFSSVKEADAKIVGIGILVISFVIFLINAIIGRKFKAEVVSQGSLLKALTKNANTVYFVLNEDISEVKFMTANADKVLGFKLENHEEAEGVLFDILNNPIIEHNMRDWDSEKEFISPMISFKHASYNGLSKHIKVRIFPNLEKKKKEYIISVSNVEDEYSDQHKLIQQASDIKSREKKLNQITADSYDVEFNVDLNTGKFTLKNLNDNAYYLGKDENGLYGSRIVDIIDAKIFQDDKEEVLEKISLTNLEKLATKEFEPESFRFRIQKSTDIEWFESTVFITNDKGLKNATILTKNVTENAEYVKKQNKLLEEALVKAETANAAKSEFIKALSHDIRTPLNVILGLSESYVNAKENKEDFKTINAASKNLLEIIDGLLDIEEIEKGSVKLKEAEYNTSKLFVDLLKMTTEYIGEKEILFTPEIDKEIPSKLFGDKSKLNRILMNILQNAVIYTDKGEIKLRISHIQKGGNSNLKFEIIDNGRGIAKDKLKAIFKKTNSKHKSGLVIVKDLLDLLKGSIGIESEEGKGTKVTINIDQKIIDSTEIGELSTYKENRKQINYFNATGKKILIVEDNKLNLKVAHKLLEPYKFEVIDVDSGLKCIDLISKGEKFDLILLDQMMPKLSGVDTLKKLLEDPEFKTPVIALTADAVKGARENYIKEGFDDYLAKPINIYELHEVLTNHIK